MAMVEKELAPRSQLRDGRNIAVRPLSLDDRAGLLAFGRALPHEDLQYLPDDFENPEVINRYVGAHDCDHWRQLVACADKLIVAYGAVLRLPGWSSHVANLQLIVAGGWRRSGLGGVMAPALLDAARDMGARRAIVAILAEQCAGQAIFERLGFRVEARLVNHARDRSGKPHTMLIMGTEIG